MSGASHSHDGHDLALPPDSTQSAAQVSAPTTSSEPAAPVGDGLLDAAPGAAISTAIEPNASLVLCKARDSKVPDSVPDSESSAPLPIEPDWAPIMEFTTADVFQHSPFLRYPGFTKVSLFVRRALAGLWSARLGCGRRRNSKPTHLPLCSHRQRCRRRT